MKYLFFAVYIAFPSMSIAQAEPTFEATVTWINTALETHGLDSKSVLKIDDYTKFEGMETEVDIRACSMYFKNIFQEYHGSSWGWEADRKGRITFRFQSVNAKFATEAITQEMKTGLNAVHFRTEQQSTSAYWLMAHPHDSSNTNYAYLILRKGTPKDIFLRLAKAFNHLIKLAKENPSCTEPF